MFLLWLFHLTSGWSVGVLVSRPAPAFRHAAGCIFAALARFGAIEMAARALSCVLESEMLSGASSAGAHSGPTGP